MNINRRVYVAGRKFAQPDGTEKFGLMRPSQSRTPYFTTDPASRTMRLLRDNGSRLYLVDFDGKSLVNSDEVTDVCPAKIRDTDLFSLALDAVETSENRLS